MKKAIIILLITIGKHAVAQCNDPIVNMLRGTWVKTSGSADTIKFSMKMESNYRFELILANRKGPFGLYEFRSLGTTMLVHLFASNNSGSEAVPFYFDKSLKQLSIGNFYHADDKEKLLTFRKIK